jgi:prepilin-type N-terminal cleavage/methylation domain-containing protein
MRRQRGYTLVEMIVAVAVTSLVIGAVFPMFLLLDRINSAWTSGAQARAVGLTAEVALVEDVRADHVVQAGPNTLVLQTVPLPGDPADTPWTASFCVTYSIQPGVDPSLPRLVRTVTRPRGVTIASTTVAHGVISFTTWSPSANSLAVALTLAGVGGTSVVGAPSDLITTRTNSSEWRSVCP